MISKSLQQFFESYYEEHGRNFPWRQSEIDRYRILITEILLRRTRAQKVSEIWRDFFSSFPDITSLDSVNEQELSQFLNPLGLQNTRAKQLKKLASMVQDNYGGQLPEDTTQLPGVGQYADGALKMMKEEFRAIPEDVNIRRVLGRLNLDPNLNLDEVTSLSTDNKKNFLLGILDFASEICMPRNPRCSDCDLAGRCGFADGAIDFTSSQSYTTYAAQVVVLSVSEYNKFKKRGSLAYDVNGKTKKSCYVYVQKPLSVIIGTASLEKGMLLSLKTFDRQVHLEQIRILTPQFNLRKPITWLSPLSSFKMMLRKILKK